MERARIILEEPALLFFIFYAGAFFGGLAAIDLMPLFVDSSWSQSGFSRYVYPVVMAVPPWIGLRSWAKRVLDEHPSEAKI